jgi:hypothetical protein
MPAGTSFGLPRKYQQLGRDTLKTIHPADNLIPYSKDGIDVPIELCGGKVYFDVALKSNISNKVVVAECKLVARTINQNTVFAFWGEVEQLRRTYGYDISAYFITTSNYQSGPIKMAKNLGIELVKQSAFDTPEEFKLVFKWFDTLKKKTANRTHYGKTLQAEVKMEPSLSMKVIRADGTIEEIDN